MSHFVREDEIGGTCSTALMEEMRNVHSSLVPCDWRRLFGGPGILGRI